FLSLLMPSSNILQDPFYNLLFLLVGIISLLAVWRFEFNKPFKGKLGGAVLWVSLMCLGFWLLNSLRVYWVDRQIMRITNDQYEFPRFFLNRIELWIG